MSDVESRDSIPIAVATPNQRARPEPRLGENKQRFHPLWQHTLTATGASAQCFTVLSFHQLLGKILSLRTPWCHLAELCPEAGQKYVMSPIPLVYQTLPWVAAFAVSQSTVMVVEDSVISSDDGRLGIAARKTRMRRSRH
jgi:hypothetical protein